MSEVRHTPGPWAINRTITAGNQSVAFHITGPRDGSVSPVCYGSDTGYGGELDANARLIAAAPDFYQAARAIEWALQSGHDAREVLDENSQLRDALRDAIAKAEGVTP